MLHPTMTASTSTTTAHTPAPSTKRLVSKHHKPHGSIVTEVRPHDILLGRGTGPNENPGNRFFRNIITSNRSKYTSAKTRKEKELVIQQTICAVRKLRGRFLKKLTRPISKRGVFSSDESSVFQVVEDKAAIRLKTQLAFRYAINGPGTEEGPTDGLPRETFQSSHHHHDDDARTPVLDLTSHSHRHSPRYGSSPPTTAIKPCSPRMMQRIPSPSTCFTPVSTKPFREYGAPNTAQRTASRYSALDVLAQASAVMASTERHQSQSPTDIASIWNMHGAESQKHKFTIGATVATAWDNNACDSRQSIHYEYPSYQSTCLNLERRIHYTTSFRDVA